MILWPLGVYFVLVAALVTAMIAVSHFLGGRHDERATGTPYESGIEVTGSARVRLPIHFYLVAMFFVVFDLEAAFLFAWAVAARRVGWSGFAEAATFVGILAVALVYLWRIGALDWGTSARIRRGSPVEPELR